MELKLLIFDLDDTLISTEALYQECRERMAMYLEELGFNYDEALKLHRDIDRVMVGERGVELDRFPESMVRTYDELCKKHYIKYDSKTEDYVRSVGYSVYRQHSEIKKGVPDILNALQNYHMCVLTRGDITVQTRRALNVNGLKYFSNFFTTPKKTPELFNKICSFYDVSPEEAAMVGNSVYSDILPALEGGLFGFYLQNGTYELEAPREIDPDIIDRMIHISSLGDILEILEINNEKEKVND